MNKIKTTNPFFYWTFLLFSLMAIFLYSYVKFFQHPYVGFRWKSNGANGQITFVFVKPPNTVSESEWLKPGDKLLQVGSVIWADYDGDLRKPLFDPVQTGQIVPILINRDGQHINISWEIPGPNFNEVSDIFLNEGFLALAFWMLGTFAFLNIRPKNGRWVLLTIFNFLTAIWLAAGSMPAATHLWESAIVLRVCVWLSIPVYLHLSLAFPKPLVRISPKIIWLAYLLAAGMAIAQIFQFVPSNLYIQCFLPFCFLSLILLVVHAIFQSEVRKEIALLIPIVIIAFMPFLVMAATNLFVSLPGGYSSMGLISLPLLPVAYFYAIARRQMGELEVRFNQALSVYLYIIFLSAAFLPVILWADVTFSGPGTETFTGIMVLFGAALITIFGYERFQRWVDRLVFGVSLSREDLMALYTGRIITSISFSGLQKILESETLPRLHISEFVFLQIDRGTPQVLYTIGVETKNMPIQQALAFSGEMAGKYRPAEASETGDPFAWVRLSLELKIGSELVGLWLFGRHDPDDFYSYREIDLLRLLANQTAIAVSNIVQTGRAMEMYEQDANRHEEHRLHLAQELHDSVLHQLAVLGMNLSEDATISERFQSNYDDLVDRLRQIVSDLRPPMLNYGLHPAIEDLTDELAERNTGLSVEMNVEASEERCDSKVEQHIFRITQEACENAIHNGHATKISLSGYLRPEEIRLQIEDNGCGFDLEQGAGLADLLSKKHFGLVGMMERARAIGGEVRIHSNTMDGTRIQVKWNAPEAV